MGEGPLESKKVDIGQDGESQGTFIQILAGTEQAGAEYSDRSLRALDGLCEALYSYAAATTLAEDRDDVDGNLSGRHYHNTVLDFGFVVDDFDVNKLRLIFYSYPKDEPHDLATISFTGEELKGFVMNVGAQFGLDLELGDPAEAEAPTLGPDPFAD